MYVYGGYNGTTIFSDLHKLDLNTLTWSRVQTVGRGPQGMAGLTTLDYRIYPCRSCALVIGNKLVLLVEEYETTTSAIFTLHLRSMRWARLKGTLRCEAATAVGTKTPKTTQLLSLPKHIPFNPAAKGNPSMLMMGKNLYVIGGDYRSHDHRNPRDPRIHIWQLSLPRVMDWEQERILWIACFKNDRTSCQLAKCPPHIIYDIIGYVNGNAFCVK